MSNPPMPAMPDAEAEQEVKRQYEAATANLQRNGARIVVMGATGTGKTSLINAVFQRSCGVVGHSMPCTQTISRYPPDSECPVWVYDTKGFEPLSENQDIMDDLRNLWTEHQKNANRYRPNSPEYHAECLHAVWWVTADRLEPSLQNTVQEIFQSIPIFIVVNKCDKKEEEVDVVLNDVQKLCPWAAAVVPVVATPKNGPIKKKCETCGCQRIVVMEGHFYECRNQDCVMYKEEVQLKQHYGIESLLRQTVVRLPEMVAESFHVAEVRFLNDLDSMANHRIALYTAIAASIGASPIPFSDFPLLMANEVAMFVNLGAVYEVKVDPRCAKQVVSAFSGLASGAGVGYTLGSAIKMIPVIGTVLGGMTQSVIATTVTAAIGATVKELLRRVRREAVFGEVTFEHFKKAMSVDEMSKMFQDNMRLGGRQSTGGALPTHGEP